MPDLTLSNDPAALRVAIGRCMASERPTLLALWRRIEVRVGRGQPVDRLLGQLRLRVETGLAQRVVREATMPSLEFPEALPVSLRRGEIEAAIRAYPVVVVCGETGSGKTTQLPKICLAAGRGRTGLIGHTQPRRLAARTVAARIAEELGGELGGVVGYQVRFREQVGADSLVKVMTDGILLAESQGDPDLLRYDTLIVDEAHERSLNIDFLLGYLKGLLARRPDLKLVITSATIDPARFARHFGGAPVIEVSGRTWPVEVRYRPLEDDKERSQAEAIRDAVEELCREGPGDILVFLSGEREIRETAEVLRRHGLRDTEVLPLFARLSLAEQTRVFAPHRGRRIVLATNVAETSLTVPGIRFVVDPGRARISRFNQRSKVQRLPVEAISQASADQRKGRCGRVAAGVCIRLYSEEDFAARPAFTTPEILRTNLAAVILRMQALGLGTVENFPFLEPPDPRQVRAGVRLLQELGALDATQALTPLGRELARLPIDPRIARMLLAAVQEGCVTELLVIAAAMEIQDPRERPLEAREAADQAHAPFRHERSDFLAWLNLWNWYQPQRKHLTQRKLRKLCREHFLSWNRMREWWEMHSQLKELMLEGGRAQLNPQAAEYDAIHRALLSGLLGNVGLNQEGREYLGANGLRFQVFPGSVLAKGGGKWIVAGELLETQRIYGAVCAQVRPEWVERVGAQLLRRSCFEPHWEKRAGRVVGFERLTLYGLPVVPRRRIDYGPVDSGLSRELFIREALVPGEILSRGRFLEHNRQLITEVEALEHKSRRRDVLADEQTLYDFYDRMLPEDVHDARAFERWRKRVEQDEPRRLYLTRELLMRHAAGEVHAGRFPDQLQVNGLTLPLEYRFEPGQGVDGVRVRIPLAALNQLHPEPFEWLVPGLLEERITALIRSLPKALRRSFVPAPDFARACVEALEPGQGALMPALTRQLQRMTGVAVPADAWNVAALPEHLRMAFEVVDGQGKTLALERDLEALQRRLGGQAAAAFTPPPQVETRPPARDWMFGRLQRQVSLQRQGVTIRAWPALEDRGEAVGEVLKDSPQSAEATHREGVRRLLRLLLARQVKDLGRRLPGLNALCLAYTKAPPDPWEPPGEGGCGALREDIVTRVLDQVFGLDGELPWDEGEFRRRLETGRSELVAAGDRLAGILEAVLNSQQRLRARLSGNLPLAWLEAVEDMRSQLEHLVYRGFLRRVDGAMLSHLPRYLKALELRLQRLEQDPSRDRARRLKVAPLWRACLAREAAMRARQESLAPLMRYRWLLEEYRVSLFAQELRTAEPVSEKRLAQVWQELA